MSPSLVKNTRFCWHWHGWIVPRSSKRSPVTSCLQMLKCLGPLSNICPVVLLEQPCHLQLHHHPLHLTVWKSIHKHAMCPDMTPFFVERAIWYEAYDKYKFECISVLQTCQLLTFCRLGCYICQHWQCVPISAGITVIVYSLKTVVSTLTYLLPDFKLRQKKDVCRQLKEKEK